MSLETGTVYVTEQNLPVVIPEGISIFGFTVSFFGVCMVLALLVGLFVTKREAQRRKQDAEWFLSVISIVVIFGLLGARVYYALFHWDRFAEQPLQLLCLRKGGFSYFGALIASIVALKIYCRKKAADFFKTVDVLAMGAAMAAIPVWIGCIFSFEPIGRYSNGVFSVRFSQVYLPQGKTTDGLDVLWEYGLCVDGVECVSAHPVAVYGLLGALLTVIGMLIAKRVVKRDGALFWSYVMLVSVTLLVTDLFRGGRFLIWGTKISLDGLVAGVFMVAAIVRPMIMRHIEKKKQ